MAINLAKTISGITEADLQIERIERGFDRISEKETREYKTMRNHKKIAHYDCAGARKAKARKAKRNFSKRISSKWTQQPTEIEYENCMVRGHQASWWQVHGLSVESSVIAITA